MEESRYLVILEVSQKQAYIFGSNKVADNIVNSAVIAKCLSPEYIDNTLKGSGYKPDDNLVYSGGGHTILQYNDIFTAKKQVFLLTEKIYREFDGLSVFAKITKYDKEKTPRENLIALTAELEKKKALRQAGFRHGSFGVEKTDANTLKPKSCDKCEAKDTVRREEYNIEAFKYTPENYNPTIRFEDLGGEKDLSNFVAVVHIDGNGMGARVTELYEKIGCNWDHVKNKLKEFSDCIDEDFKNAYKEMTEEVATSIEDGLLKGKLLLKTENGKPYFPVRRIITAGDDICFVTEGRIGIECARIFIEKLIKKRNKVDGAGYAACAGVAIVHQKYPFYRAYELAESLCSKAKKAGAKKSPGDNGRNVCSVDWHIEFGELKDNIEDLERDYIADDKSRLSYRPYVIAAGKEVMKSLPAEEKYSFFADNMRRITDKEKKYGDGKIKRLRQVIKKGVYETENYVNFYKMEDLNATFNKNGDVCTNPVFDAIELMDTFFFV